MKIKTSELTGCTLDWAVAKCEGFVDYRFDGVNGRIGTGEHFNPSTDWAQGGPIIEREGINITVGLTIKDWWAVQDSGAGFKANGPTPLVAGMRAYVASKLGDEVKIPEELLT